MATFYPLPHELNQAVLRSLGIGSSKDAGVANMSDGSSARSSPGLMQPAMGYPSDMDMDAGVPSSTHGPQCKSIPQLSVHEDQPAVLAYSP
ncbi:hypothetical protein MCAP1_002215 [Malassezia caprae]|uniref:Uncharacterized protein n=1 Tax=Malassezia caprae TaxID=1381934 RepID=A0AAF0IVT5_9BASI|nr:hypothetical protein MCAP1_002215 [Malassezia caprae]